MFSQVSVCPEEKRDPHANTTYDALDMIPTLPPKITPGFHIVVLISIR